MQSKKAYELVTTGRPDDPAFPHAMVLTVSFVISPVIGLVCHRRLAVDPQNLTPASRRQDHTTSPSAFGTVRQRCLIASIASRPASVTIASAPWWDETARLSRCFASERKQDIFSDWAGQVICETARPASLRAQRSNPASEPQSWLDCFVASLPAQTQRVCRMTKYGADRECATLSRGIWRCSA